MKLINEVRICLKQEYSQISIDDYIYDGKKSAKIFFEKLGNGTIERSAALFIDSQYRPICYSTIGMGQDEKVNINVSELFKIALLSNAKFIIIAHNHPNGDLMPTDEDIKLTKNVGSVGKILGINLIDSLIIGNDKKYLSIRLYATKKEEYIYDIE